MTVTPMTATSSFRISTHGSSRKFFKWRLRVKSCSIIAKELGEKQVLRPQAYLHEKFGTFASDIVLTYPYAWDHSTVRAILMNQVYIGNMVHFRTGTQKF